MSRESLVHAISQHLNASTRVGRLQADMMLLKQKRLDEVVTLKQRPDGGVYHSDLMKALKQKGLSLDAVKDEDGNIIGSELAKVNINLVQVPTLKTVNQTDVAKKKTYTFDLTKQQITTA